MAYLKAKVEVTQSQTSTPAALPIARRCEASLLPNSISFVLVADGGAELGADRVERRERSKALQRATLPPLRRMKCAILYV